MPGSLPPHSQHGPGLCSPCFAGRQTQASSLPASHIISRGEGVNSTNSCPRTLRPSASAWHPCHPPCSRGARASTEACTPMRARPPVSAGRRGKETLYPQRCWHLSIWGLRWPRTPWPTPNNLTPTGRSPGGQKSWREPEQLPDLHGKVVGGAGCSPSPPAGPHGKPD